MEKTEYPRLLSETFIDDSSKFRVVSLERPSRKGRTPTYYHQKDLDSIVRRILPKSITDTIRPTAPD